MTESPSNNYDDGAMMQTDRTLDLAIQGNGWFAVQDAQGNEAYTRAGSMQLSAEGLLQDARGNIVIGDAGPIALPIPLDNINIADDGTISLRPLGAPETVLEEVGRLKLVNPDYRQMQRGVDGLFRQKDGAIADDDDAVRIGTGMLEVSNVNAIEEMVSMITLQRHYEMQVKMMKKADELSMRGNMLMRII
jgi:flagellar basal-body rod protein FlgF